MPSIEVVVDPTFFGMFLGGLKIGVLLVGIACPILLVVLVGYMLLWWFDV